MRKNDMIMDNIIKIVGKVVISMLAALAIFCLHSCEPDSWNKVYVPEDQAGKEGREEYVVNVSGIIGEEQGTRSILGTDSDSNPFIKDSGYQVFAFNRRAGVLEAVVGVDSRSTSATLKLSSKDTYDFFVVGNLWLLDSNGAKAGWDTFFTKVDKYPAKAVDMKDESLMPCYRFDGGALGSTGLRTETFAEVATYGIPYSGKAEGVTYENSRSGVAVPVKRLFSKVTLTVDHSGLIGPSGNVDAFVNESIYLRQVNCRVHPFIEGIAAAAEDILPDGKADYEASPVNGAAETFVFYVPENCGGTYDSVTKSSDKVPSAAGSRSGCVTYLEFVGKLDPAKAGGYGGTLKYQFCLGGNATSDYNVVRNSNYKVELGFKAGSLFDAASWKLDMGTGLTDTRVLGLRGDAAGTQILKNDGTQVIAVRPANSASNKKDLYLFFNHNGGASNEAASYVDEYASGYTPADATRSALQISCPDMSADVIRYDYEPSTGKISFWTDSPTALTPGHEYTVTFKLLPEGSVPKTVSAKIKTVADMGVSADFSNYYIGMKRSLTATGFCGSNVMLKVKTGGNDLLCYSNSGTDYITSSGIQLTGATVPVYAYKNGSLTLTVTSDDAFNDTGADFDITVNKPVPYYGDIPHNIPIAVPGGDDLLADAIHLPLDGTPVDIPVYYRDASNNRINVGDGAGDFDKAVFAQVLSFTGDMRSDDYYGMDENFRFFCRRMKDKDGKFFGQYAGVPVSGTAMRFRLSASRIYPKNTTIFNEESDKKNVYFCTFCPGFFGEDRRPRTWEQATLESDYFNYWNSAWDFREVDKIDDDVILSNWPTIVNRSQFNLTGCAKSNLDVTDVGEWQEFINVDGENFITDVSGNVYIEWRFEPSKVADFCEDYGTSRAPYGTQNFNLTLTNIQSGETVKLTCPSFELKYKTVQLCTYGIYESGGSDAKLYVGAPLSFAQMLLERASHALDYSPLINVPLNAFSEIRISRTELGAFQPAARETPTNSLEFFAKSSGQWAAGNCSRFFAGNSEFIRTNMEACGDNHSAPYEIVTANQFESFTFWDEQSFSAVMEHGWGLPYDYYFYDGNSTYSELPKDLYTNKDLYDVIKFQFDRNGGYEGIRTNTGTRPRRIGWIEM